MVYTKYQTGEITHLLSVLMAKLSFVGRLDCIVKGQKKGLVLNRLVQYKDTVLYNQLT